MVLRIRTIVRLLNAVHQLDRLPSTHDAGHFRAGLEKLSTFEVAKIARAVDELRIAARDLEAVTIAGVEGE